MNGLMDGWMEDRATDIYIHMDISLYIIYTHISIYISIYICSYTHTFVDL